MNSRPKIEVIGPKSITLFYNVVRVNKKIDAIIDKLNLIDFNG